MALTEAQDTEEAQHNVTSHDPYAFSGGYRAALNYIAPILPFLAGRERIVDIGCGEGWLLYVLRDLGIMAEGVEQNTTAANHLRRAGFNVAISDAHHYLYLRRAGFHVPVNDAYTYVFSQDASHTQAGLDAIVLSHIIEHFDAEGQQTLLYRATQALRPHGGRLVVVTPNLRNPVVAAEGFYLDPTHLRPMPLPLLIRYVEQEGLTVIGAGATWPWERARLKADMRRQGLDAEPKSWREVAFVLRHYARLAAHYGPQLNLLRGDTWLVAERR